MILLDAYALVALLAEEPAADQVDELIARGDCGVTTINLAEALDVIGRRWAVPVGETYGAVAPMFRSERLAAVTSSADDARRAAALRVAYYTPRARSLSIADCFLLAAARSGDGVATADPPVAAVARELALDVVALPDSTGRRT